MSVPTANLHPFVYQIRIVKESEYPDISYASIEPVVIADNYVMVSGNIYSTYKANGSEVTLGVLRPQDYHEHYYINDSAVGVGGPFVYGTPATRSKTYYFNQKLYVMTDDNSLTLRQYELATTGNDVSLNWSVSGLLGTNFTRAAGDNTWGTSSFSEDPYVYSYVTDNTDILIQRLDRYTGALVEGGTIMVTGFDSSISSLKIDQTGISDIFIAHCDGSDLRLTTYDFASATLTPSHTVANDVREVPSMYSYSDISGRGHCTLVYNESANIVLVDAKTQTLHGIREFGMPTIYSINKGTRFVEGVTYLPNRDITASCKHAVNPNILFFAYVTPEQFIRVLKLYRYLPAGDSRYVYVILWATLANSTSSAFCVNIYGGDIEEYHHSSTTVSSLMMTTDDCGHVYVFAQDEGLPPPNTLKIWKIREYLLDFGHDHLGDIPVDPHILQRALADITDYYNISTWEPSFYFGDLPSIGDVIVTDVSFGSSGYGRTIDVTLKYLNYNIIQFDTSTSLSLATDLTNCFRAIHNRADINLLNFNIPAGVLFEGTDITLTAKFPALNIIKPCVLRGTEVVRYDPAGQMSHLVYIESIVAGDLVTNQDGRPVRVLEHRCNKILTDSWTAPYIVPRDYFGKDRPYHPLFISGDHGIKYGRQRLYACRMKGAFRRMPESSIVEYHHLLLEDDEHNFYIANGLLVESLHRGVYPLGRGGHTPV